MDTPARFDPALVVRDGLRAAGVGHEVVLGRDAAYTGEEPVTVVIASQTPASGSLPSNRWLFRASVTLSTTGPDVDVTADAAEAAADALLGLVEVGTVRLSSTTCVSEPVRTGSTSPSDSTVTFVSTYTSHLRRDEGR